MRDRPQLPPPRGEWTSFLYALNSEPKALTGDKSEGIKSRGAAEAFIYYIFFLGSEIVGIDAGAPPPLAAAFMYMYRLTGGSISGLLRRRATANPFTRASVYSWSSKGNTSTTV